MNFRAQDKSQVVGRICALCKMFVLATSDKHVCHKSASPEKMPKCHSIKPRTIAKTSSFKQLMQELNDEADKELEVQNTSVVEEETELLDFSTQLIIEVEKRRPLWDVRLPKADRYPQIINRLWMEIINVLNCGSLYTTKRLEKKIGYLKEQYRREKSKLIKPSGAQGGKHLKQWMHFKSLTFLDEVYIQNKTISNIEESDPENNAINNANKGNESYTSTTGLGSKKRKSLVSSDGFGELLLEELKASRPKTPPPLQKLSSDESFCSYLGSLMSDLPTTSKRRLQGEFISTVISELNY